MYGLTQSDQIWYGWISMFLAGQPRLRRVPNFSESLTYAHIYGFTENDQIWYDNTCGDERVSRGQPRPHANGAQPRFLCF